MLQQFTISLWNKAEAKVLNHSLGFIIWHKPRTKSYLNTAFSSYPINDKAIGGAYFGSLRLAFSTEVPKTLPSFIKLVVSVYGDAKHF